MIKKLNIISFIILLITSLLSLFTYHDDMDVNIPYIDTVFILLSIVLGLLLFFKINLRWQALILSLKYEGYSISKLGFRNAIVYESINIIFYLLVGGALLLYVGTIWFVGLAILLHFIEGVLHLITNAIYKPYKIIVNENIVMTIANSIHILKWHQVKKVEGKHNDIHLVDQNNQIHILDMDLISFEDSKLLINKLKTIALSRNLYFSVSEK